MFFTLWIVGQRERSGSMIYMICISGRKGKSQNVILELFRLTFVHLVFGLEFKSYEVEIYVVNRRLLMA